MSSRRDWIQKIYSSFFRARKKKQGDANDLDRALVKRFQKKQLPRFSQLRYLSRFFSTRERRIVNGALAVVVLTLLAWGVVALNAHLTTIPAYGGEYREGIVGYPQLLNPLYASANEVDADVSGLIFSGLLRYNNDQTLVPDLASHYETNETQTEYIVTLRDDAYWHDGEKVTTDDVITTFELIQESRVASPLRVSFQGVTIKKLDGNRVSFTLEKPFAPFLNSLTVGILPSHLWSGVAPEEMRLSSLNVKPVGSGPYAFEQAIRDSSGRIVGINLKSADAFYGKKPFITHVNFAFYPAIEDALKDMLEQKTDGIQFLPQRSKEQAQRKFLTWYPLQLSQYTSIFFNQKSNTALKETPVRRAFAHAINKQRITNEALKGEGHPIVGPILKDSIGYDPALEDYRYDPQEAKKILTEAGWKEIDKTSAINLKTAQVVSSTQATAGATGTAEETKTLSDEEKTALRNTVASSFHEAQNIFWEKNNTLLEIDLTTANTPELAKVAELISGFWEEIGVVAPVKTVEPQPRTMINEVLKPRAYQALIYGEIIGADPDLYPFWHSSQAEYPGLNLAGYADRDVDDLLVTARQATSTETRVENYKTLQKLLHERIPAIFLYTPTYTHAVNKRIKGIEQKRISVPSDRFSDIAQWYIKTDSVWKK